MNNDRCLTRNFFEKSLEIIKDKKICVIPWLKENQITRIERDALKDWQELKVLVIPPTVNYIDPNAVDFSNIEIIVTNLPIPNSENIIILPYDNNVESLIYFLEKIFECQDKEKDLDKKINININDIEKRGKEVNDIIDDYLKEIENKEKSFLNIIDKFKELDNLINGDIDAIQPFYETFQKGVEQKITETTKNLEDTFNQLQQQTELSSDELKELRKSLAEFNKTIKIEISKCIEDSKANIKKEINSQTKKLDEVVIQKTNEIDLKAQKILDNIYSKKEELTNNIVEEAVSRIQQKQPYKNLIININGVEKLKVEGALFHKSFNDVLKVLSLRLHPMLVGPAGSGKNVILEQAAKALDLKFHYVNDVTEEHKVMGFVDANGNFQKTQFFEAFTNGGLIMIDEMDNSHPSALLAINAGLGTGYHHYLTFPDGKLYESSPNFYLAAAANTYGTGSDSIYCGRSSLDGASLNRFIPIFIDYDRELESNLIRHTEILNLYWAVRESISKNKIRHVISTRNIVNADKMIESKMFDYDNVFDFTIIQSMSEDDLLMVYKDLNNSSDNMIQEFIAHLKNKGLIIENRSYRTF